MKNLYKYLSLVVMALIVMVFTGCEGLFTPNDLTGGMECPQVGYLYPDAYNPIWVNGYSEGDGSQYLYTDSMYLNADQVRGTAERTFVTDNPVDLTCINTIAIDWENIGFNGENNRSYLVVSASSKFGRYNNNDKYLERIRPFTRRIDTLDVSTLTGTYYIRVHALDDGWDGRSTINVYSIELIESNFTSSPEEPIVLNGGFETGNFTGWKVTTSNKFPYVQSEYGGHSGAYSTFMGDGADGLWSGVTKTNTASIEQTVKIPNGSDNLKPLLSFYYLVINRSDTSETGWDWMKVYINDNEIFRVDNDTNGWKEFTYDLSSYMGSTITLKVSSWTNDVNDRFFYFVDNITITWH
jgi:hypothetical protein